MPYIALDSGASSPFEGFPLSVMEMELKPFPTPAYPYHINTESVVVYDGSSTFTLYKVPSVSYFRVDYDSSASEVTKIYVDTVVSVYTHGEIGRGDNGEWEYVTDQYMSEIDLNGGYLLYISSSAYWGIEQVAYSGWVSRPEHMSMMNNITNIPPSVNNYSNMLVFVPTYDASGVDVLYYRDKVSLSNIFSGKLNISNWECYRSPDGKTWSDATTSGTFTIKLYKLLFSTSEIVGDSSSGNVLIAKAGVWYNRYDGADIDFLDAYTMGDVVHSFTTSSISGYPAAVGYNEVRKMFGDGYRTYFLVSKQYALIGESLSIQLAYNGELPYYVIKNETDTMICIIALRA